MPGLKKWLLRWKRSDLPHLRLGWLRLKCERAAILLEFALVFPILLMMTLFLIDLCLYWDGVTMANHAAFTVGRIARVHYDYGKEEFTVPESLLGQVDSLPEYSRDTWPYYSDPGRGIPCSRYLREGPGSCSFCEEAIGDIDWRPAMTESEERLAPIAALFMAGVTHETGDAGALEILMERLGGPWIEEEPVNWPNDWQGWMDTAPDPSSFVQNMVNNIVGSVTNYLIQEVAGPLVNVAFDRLLGSEYGDQIGHLIELGSRYAMARRKFSDGEARLSLQVRDLTADGTDRSKEVSFEHPSSKADPSYGDTKIVTVAIDYPRRVLWRPFGRDDAHDPGYMTLRGRWTSLIEPEKLVPHPDYD